MSSLVVLDRVVEDFIPEYSVYGMSKCCRCKSLVYVGHQTARALNDKEADIWPICMECALELGPEKLGQPTRNIEDGLCPKCGGKHLP
jgi:hypothetical protein